MATVIEDARTVVQNIYAAARAQDLLTMDSYLDEAFVTLEADGLPYAGRYEGAEGFHTLFYRLAETWDGARTTDIEYLADGDSVVAIFNLLGTSKATGTTIDMPIMELWRVRDGKALSCQPYYFDTLTIAKACGTA